MRHFLFTSFRWQKNQQWKKSFFNIIFLALGICGWLICHPSFVVANDLSQDDQEAQKAECVQTLIDQFDSSRARDNGRIAKEAQSKALGWDELACCQGLIDILDDGLARA